MELKFNGDGNRPKLPTLRQLIAQIQEDEQNNSVLPIRTGLLIRRPPAPPKTFMFDGYVYAIILGQGGNVSLGCDPDYPCLNLRSQTIRAIDLDRQVEPIHAEVHVPANKTHRYSHL